MLEMADIASPENVQTILDLCPNISRADIRHDLQMTGSLERTINRILDGQLVPGNDESGMGSPEFGEHEQHTPLDLPVIQRTQRPKKTNVRKNKPVRSDFYSDSSDVETEKPVHAISSDEDDPKITKTSASYSDSPCGGSHSNISATRSNYSDEYRPNLDDISDDNPKSLSKCSSTNTAISDTGLDNFDCEEASAGSVVAMAAETICVSPVKRRKLNDGGTEGNFTSLCDKKQQKLLKEREREEKKRLKEEEKARKAAEREAKKREKEQEAARRKALQQSRKNFAKPGECLKLVTVMLDTALMQLQCSKVILEELQRHDVRYEVQQQRLPNMVTWWREVTHVKDTPGGGVTTETTEQLQPQVLVLLSADKFIPMVAQNYQASEGDTLRNYIEKSTERMENRQVTLMVQGLEKYFRDQKTRAAQSHRKRALAAGGQGSNQNQARSKGTTLPDLSRIEVEEALVDLQLTTSCTVHLHEKDEDMGKAVFRFTKAVAEMPFKQERLKTGFDFHLESGASVKIDKDGNGIQKAWKQMLQQFKNVSAEFANAIIREYPSPWKLHRAYEACESPKEAEQLLQDIMVRRGAGVTETTRRVGKEMSRRLYELFTARDPEFIIT